MRVQRAGGLGSDARFSLNGLTDDQIRFFLDGVPLELAGYPFGMSNVPVNLVERVEIYRGVVPIRFGADALGGAVNLVSDRDVWGTHASASYQVGSFGTQRLALSAEHLDEEPPATSLASAAFVDLADNDYPMSIEVAGRSGPRGSRARSPLPRRRTARRARTSRRAWWTSRGRIDWPSEASSPTTKEIQHNLVMTFNPYGDVDAQRALDGGVPALRAQFEQRLSLSAVAGYAHRVQTLRRRRRVRVRLVRAMRSRAGPTRGARAAARRTSVTAKTRFTVASTSSGRCARTTRSELLFHPPSPRALGTSDARRTRTRATRCPPSARLFAFLTGVEYEIDLFDERLEKYPVREGLPPDLLRSEDPLSNGTFRREDRETHRFGLGDSLRYALRGVALRQGVLRMGDAPAARGRDFRQCVPGAAEPRTFAGAQPQREPRRHARRAARGPQARCAAT